ncbi:uncharacterized protein C8Q71DRAFT_452292 [Rhodofomes roseus]|uniref:Uncharacterized protein n=1 Tax=Rhodofomes roseus TaxID=34475 RepID=A0ABQ8JYD6_9APHY|nr:uncharacterized protein C8Q71DRAFT_452292 [Rhodofomes roseus]KAH9828962.1 hypothetical protein C8Q71DRAFT_452292 [Rhodofomes roseus]
MRPRSPGPISAPPSAQARLKSANAIKAMLRDSLNLLPHETEPEPDRDLNLAIGQETMPCPASPRNARPGEDEAHLWPWPEDGCDRIQNAADLGVDTWVEEVEDELDENMNVGGGLEDGYARKRCNSAASVATVREGSRKSDTNAAVLGKGSKKITVKPRTVSAKRKGLKRSHASRNLKLDLDMDDSRSSTSMEGALYTLEDDGFDDVFPHRTENCGASSTSAASLPTTTPAMQQIMEFLQDEETDEHSDSGSKFSALLNREMRPHERFEISIKLKTKHIVMWDVNLDHTYALEGLVHVKDLKPHGFAHPLKPVSALTINWQTVDARGDTPAIAAPTLYETDFRGGAALMKPAHVLTALNPARGIHAEISWTYLPPGVRGAGRGGAWALRFWVPVPMWLFKGREMLRSMVTASVLFGEGTPDAWTGYSGTMEVTMEHLRRGREMRVCGRS